MSRARWNFRTGPVQFTSAFGILSLLLVAGLVLFCCCGSWLLGATNT